jgi:hypothetical protein
VYGPNGLPVESIITFLEFIFIHSEEKADYLQRLNFNVHDLCIISVVLYDNFRFSNTYVYFISSCSRGNLQQHFNNLQLYVPFL